MSRRWFACTRSWRRCSWSDHHRRRRARSIQRTRRRCSYRTAFVFVVGYCCCCEVEVWVTGAETAIPRENERTRKRSTDPSSRRRSRRRLLRPDVIRPICFPLSHPLRNRTVRNDRVGGAGTLGRRCGNVPVRLGSRRTWEYVLVDPRRESISAKRDIYKGVYRDRFVRCENVDS